MNPNMPIQNPNIYNGPAGGEPVPMPNQPWEHEMDDRNGLDDILREARNIEEHDSFAQARTTQYNEAVAGAANARATGNNLLEQKYNGIAGQLQASVDQGVRDRQLRRDNNNAALDTLSADTNPTSLLQTLLREHAASTANHTRAQQTADNAYDKAVDARRTNRDSQVDYTSARRHHARIPATDTAEEKRRTVTMREINSSTSRDAVGARASRTAYESHQGHLDQQSRYPDAVQALADRMRQQHEGNWQVAEQANRQITAEMRTWGIQQGPDYAGQEDTVRGMLEGYRQALENMSPVDSARAEGLANYTRLRYRLESRALHEDTLANHTNPDRAYTENRGIRLRDGTTGDEIIIHDDGTAERQEHGDWVRRAASGEVWTPPVTELVIDPNAPVEPVDVAFARWEERRTPEDAAAAYASLSEMVREQGVIEANHMGSINALTEGITNADQVLAQGPAELATAQTELARLQAGLADPAAPTRKEQKALDAQSAQVDQLRDRLATAASERPRMIAQRDAETVAMRTVREQLNPARYWQGYLEVNSERRVAEARGRVLGRFAARRAAQRQADALPGEPQLNASGTLNFDTATINGVHDTTWRMWSDGAAQRFDTTSGRTRYYDPNGVLHP